MKTCRQFKDFMLGPRDRESREVFEQHVSQCAACRSELQSWQYESYAVGEWCLSLDTTRAPAETATQLLSKATQISPPDACGALRGYLLSPRAEPDRTLLQPHLEQCATCPQELASWDQLTQRLRDWSASLRPLAITAGDVAALLQRVEASSAKTHFSSLTRRMVPAFGLAALAAVVLVAFSLWFQREDASAPAVRPPPGDAVAQSPPRIIINESGVLETRNESTLAAQVPGEGRLVWTVGDDRLALGATSQATVRRRARRGLDIELRSGTVAVQASPRHGDAPLVVLAAGHRVEVVGTRFQVSLQDQHELAVAVSEGRVRVTPAGGRTVTVEAGHQLRTGSGPDTELAALNVGQRETLERLLFSARTAEPPAESPQETRDEALSEAPREPAVPEVSQIRRWMLDEDYDKAQDGLQLLLRQRPRDARAWWLMGNCYEKTGQWAKAVAAYRRVARFGEANEANRARFMAATILQEELDQQDEAASLLKTYLSRGPASSLEPHALMRLSKAQLLLGQTEAARTTLQDLQRRYPDSAFSAEARLFFDRTTPRAP